MMGLKNIAGHDAAIFLFRFTLKPDRAISFDVNEEIVKEMPAGLSDKITPLAHACCETLARYRHLSLLSTIMDGYIRKSCRRNLTTQRSYERQYALLFRPKAY